ncbi:MAG: ABC transporter permease [Terracidiphilus sp.]|jgi:predicted permease
MRKLRGFFLRLYGLFVSRRPERDFADELESHVALDTESGMRNGLTATEARRQALIRLGGTEQTRQTWRERRRLPFLEELGQDIVYSFRMLRKNPGFALITILTLALGIGANTALFSIVNSVLLNPLPFPHPDELLAVHESKANFDQGSISYPNFRDWQRDNKTLAGLAIAHQRRFTLTGMGETERTPGDYVTSDFFSILGVKPVLGRLFAPGEDEVGRSPLVLIGQGFWARKFSSRPDILGKTITLDGRDFTIVGVLPADFDLSVGNFQAGDLYVPVGQWQQPGLNNRFAGLGFHGIARLKPGVTLAQAQADMNGVSDRLAAAYPQADHGVRANIVPMREYIVGRVQPLLLVLLGAVAFVLLIACANVANLLLARSGARAQEFAVRSALGAGRMRIVRQLLTESVMLSLAGGLLGLAIAAWGTQVVIKLVPVALPRASHIHLSAPVLCFTLLVSLVVGVLFGLLPAWKASRQKLNETLKEGSRSVSGSRHRTQGLLVIFETAMALVLLAGAGLMIRSMIAFSSVDPGFNPQGITTFSLAAPPSMSTASPDAVRAYYREVDRRILAVLGVQGISMMNGSLPMTGSDDESLFWLENEPKPASTNDMHWALNYVVEPDYLKMMGIPLLRGRFFTDADKQHAPIVAVVDEVFAHKYFGDENPVGRHINLDGYSEKATIVGVAGHVMQWGLDNDANFSLHAQIYLPFWQTDDDGMSFQNGLGTDVVIRSRGDSASTMTDIQHALSAMNQQQVVYLASTMNQLIADSLAARRFSMILLAAFAALALLLATVGIYGVISYLVSQRTQEIGIRMALGADRGHVLRWVFGQGGRLALIGVGIGLVAALALTQLMTISSMIFGVHAYDPWTLSGVTLLLVTVALAACYIPARRAMHIDPMRALRTE